MNLPNKLTVARLILAAFFVAVLSVPMRYNHTIALVLFLVASLTDYLDGAIARKWKLITDFGKLLDPLADKILTASAFICLANYGALPAWVVIIIISREFLITGLRLLASAKGVVLPAEKLGKHKTAWQMITIIYFLILLALGDWVSSPYAWEAAAWSFGAGVLVGITVLLTVYSGIAYFYKNRQLIDSA